MIRGLEITMRGEELSGRLGERIRTHEATISALDKRIKHWESDLPFEVTPLDNVQTVGELEIERQHYRDRVLCLTLLRDHIVVTEVYALDRGDLSLAELISSNPGDVANSLSTGKSGRDSKAAIDGLKLTMPGDELYRRLEQRIEDHQRLADRWKHDPIRTPEQSTGDEPLLPEKMCTSQAERHAWRAAVLGFIRDHIDAAEVYRLSESDLDFAELLPEKPGAVAQSGYDERISINFHRDRFS
jgi:hypothetical protein